MTTRSEAFAAQADSDLDAYYVLVGSSLTSSHRLVPDDVAPTHLDGLSPELDADFAARVAADGLTHVECR